MKRDYFMNAISILCILRKSLVVHKKWVTVKGKVVEKDKLGYIIPFAKSLNQFLSVPEVLHAINNSHCNEGDTMLRHI